jgi:hypothetical protein
MENNLFTSSSNKTTGGINIILIEDMFNPYNTNIRASVINSMKCSFNTVNKLENAMTVLTENPFSNFRVIVPMSKAEAFFKMATEMDIQKRSGICLSVLILIDTMQKKEKLMKQYLPSLQCTKLCFNCNIAKLKCLQFTITERGIVDFCLIPDQKEYYLQQVLSLIPKIPESVVMSIRAKSTDEARKIVYDKNSLYGSVRFLKYNSTLCPDYYQLLLIPKKLQLDKISVKVLSTIRYCRLNNVSDPEILEWLEDIYSGEVCWSSVTSYKNLIRLFVRDNRFDNLMNRSFAENDEDGILYIRYIALDIVNIMYSKQLPFFSGKLYKSMKLNKEEVDILQSLDGKMVFLNYFVVFSKNMDNNPDLNVTFEINALKPEEQNSSEYFSNFDLSLLSNKQDVLYPLMTIFKVESVVEEYDTYTVVLTEQGDNSYIKGLKPYLNFLYL